MAKDFLFVYGTLRSDSPDPGRYRELIRPHCILVGSATARGRLYEIDGYPGMTPSLSRHDAVSGELYQFVTPSPLLSGLDAYEGCGPHAPHPPEYLRKKLSVSLTDGTRVAAWTYVYNWRVNPLKRIRCGDYLQAGTDS